MSISLKSNVIKLDSIDSTNNYSQHLLATSNAADGTIVYAENQFSGKGQRGKVWIAEAGQNLSFSIILIEKNLSVENQFYLNMSIALALVGFIKFKLNEDYKVEIKWPNDVLINKQKIAGILIENSISGNHISHSIVGIGININQLKFDVIEGRQAISLKACTNHQYNLDSCLHELCAFIEDKVTAFRNQQFGTIINEFNGNLYLKNIFSNFLFEDENIQLKIIEVTNFGLLKCELVNGKIREFELNTLRFLE